MKAHAWHYDWDVASMYLNPVLPIGGLLKSTLVTASALSGIGASMVKHVQLAAAAVNSIKESDSPFKK